MKFQNDPSRYLICGTNAYKPQCREYVDERGSYNARGGSERSGIGVAPFSYKVKHIKDSMILLRFFAIVLMVFKLLPNGSINIISAQLNCRFS